MTRYNSRAESAANPWTRLADGIAALVPRLRPINPPVALRSMRACCMRHERAVPFPTATVIPLQNMKIWQ